MSRSEVARVGDVSIEISSHDALIATIERPEARNALAPSVIEGLTHALERVERDGYRAVVIRGRGGTLSAGADLRHLLTILDDVDAVGNYIAAIGEVNLLIEDSSAVTIAVVDGFALAGGCELLLSCDLAVATARAHIGDRHLEYGLLPGAGGSVRLQQALPNPLARRLMLTGEMIDGDTAHRWGLVSHLISGEVSVAEPSDAEVAEFVDALLARLGRHSSTALRQMKQMYTEVADLPHRDALAHELELLLQHLKTPTVTEGLSSFREGRAPVWPEADRH